MKYHLHVNQKKIIADTFTPVGIYLKIRDKFHNSILLESSDYYGNENSYSFICCKPIATFKVENNIISENYTDGTNSKTEIIKSVSVIDKLKTFASLFQIDKANPHTIANGLFGYISYDSVKYFEDVKINSDKKEEK
ncbi:MAG: hypothetical protein HY840_15810 [Bacteroidetes bacterium]|nr:hypothetical protein [Bacteroidota bacterium]